MEDKSKIKEFWLKELSEEIPKLGLPFDFQKATSKAFGENCLTIQMENDVYTKVNRIAGSSDVHVILFSAFYILLWKYTMQEDIVIGYPARLSGRSEEAVGVQKNYDINILPVRYYMNGNKTFKEIIEGVDKQLEQALAHGSYLVKELWEELSARETKKKSMLDVAFLLQEVKDVQFDLALEASASENGIELNFRYNGTLFVQDTISRMAEHFQNILREICNRIHAPIDTVELIGEAEKKCILENFNCTEVSYPKDKTLHKIFQEQVEKNPDRIAVIFEDSCLTYQELNKKANQVAYRLREEKIGPDKIVGIMVERSLEMMVGILAILKAGGAYMPISPEYPEDRIQYMLEDSGATVLMTQTRFKNKIPFRGKTINLEEETIYIGTEVDPKYESSPRDLAYVIYTSGSTGKPKGVMIEHYSVINRIYWMQKKYPICTPDVILQKTPFTFDVSVWELFWWFFQGLKVCFLTPGGEKDPDTMIQCIRKNKITTMHFVPSMLNIFLDYISGKDDIDALSSLRLVFASGEALNLVQVEKFNQLLYARFGTELNNLYGPTEATVDVSYFDCSKNLDLTTVPIGKPIDNIQLYVLDKHHYLQPIGVPGELFIAGDGLARGYLNRPELTMEKFVENPFVPGTKMYSTGDFAKWMPDGNIEYLGRIDCQVKLRGFRIELGEIEAEILKNKKVKEAAVIDLAEPNGSKALAAYVVVSEKVLETELREQLGKTLPEYMIPAYFTQLPKMPLSANGKLNRKLLPKPVINVKTKYVEPTNPIEQTLVEIWTALFGNTHIGILDEFYNLGGDSIKAIELILRIKTKLNIQVKLAELFHAKTVQGLARLIRDKQASESHFPVLKKAEKSDYYPATFVQQDMLKPQKILYENRFNLAKAEIFKGKFDVEKYENALISMLQRHDALRTSYHIVDGRYCFKVNDGLRFKVDYKRCNEEEAQEYMADFVRPFDMSVAPLLRSSVLQTAEDKFYVLLDMHHIIYDGVSMAILEEELWRLYKGEVLRPIEFQYKDYAVWQADLLSEGFVEYYEEYWIKKIQGYQYTQLPIDKQDSGTIEYRKAILKIDEETYAKVTSICGQWEINRSSVIIAILIFALAQEISQKDITLGMRVSNRFDQSLNDVFGCFIEKVVLRSSVEDEETAETFLKKVNSTVVDAIDNAVYPYDLLFEKLNAIQPIEHQRLFNIIVNYMVEGEPESTFPKDEFIVEKTVELMKVASIYDINFKIFDYLKTMLLEFKYKSSAYESGRIERIVSSFKIILDEILINRHCTVQDLKGHYSNIPADWNRTE